MRHNEPEWKKKVTYEQKRDDAGEKKKEVAYKDRFLGKKQIRKMFRLNIKLISIILDRDRDR